MDLYEQIVEDQLARAAVAAPTLAAVVEELHRPRAAVRTNTARAINVERDRAINRYRRDRDALTLDRTMRQLDHREAASADLEEACEVPADVAVRYLMDLPETWQKADGGRGRHLLASALFDRIDVLGLREATVHASPEAVRHGLAAVLPSELRLVVSGRGERTCPDKPDATPDRADRT